MTKKVLKFIFMIMGGLLIGAAIGLSIGFFQPSLQSFGASIIEFKWSIIFEYDILYGLFLLITLILILRIVLGIFPIRSAIARLADRADEEWRKSVEKKVGGLIISTVFSYIVTISWLAVSMSHLVQVPEGDPDENWVIGMLYLALFFIFTALTLQFIVLRFYNKVFPDRTFNWSANNPREDFFQHLDEGEKWVVYSASYKTFKIMEKLIISGIVFFVLFSLLFNQLMIVPILVLTIIWIVQNVVYFVEVGKYDK
jgi:hypothetical protein